MCGILGVVFRGPRRCADDARVVAARETLEHRGPDEAGLWSRPGVALAHRRLKVLDLEHGQQPMVSPDRRYALIYNGEVYNFADLQREYRRDGLEFATRCDTELVFKALNHRGHEALDGFNGMFALGHWDERERRLLLARDRLGKKPLYWFADAERLVFASELKAVLAYLDRKFDIDPDALDQFFARGYVLAPRTIFKGIHKLAAGHRLVLDARPERWRWSVEPWWDVRHVEVPLDEAEALDGLEALLADAVRMRLVSDVPIGCLLSGGIDSSLVTALAAKASRTPVRAFSIGFDESPEHNELPYAEAVAKRHGCDWSHARVRGGDFMAMLDETAPYLDEPYGNFAVFSMRRLARMARERLTVVLTGQGGDELCAGYPGRYNWVAQTADAAADRRGASRYAPAIDDALHHQNHTTLTRWTGPAGRAAIYSDAMREALGESSGAEGVIDAWGRSGARGRLDRVLYADVKTNLADYLIPYEERMAMSVGLEARNPLLDYRVVEYMLALPDAMKIRSDGRGGWINKWALQALARRYVPAEAIDRPKRGFTPPLALWLAQNGEAIAALFRETQAQTRGIYAPSWQAELTRGGDRGPVPRPREPAAMMPFFYSLMLAKWAQTFGRYVGRWPGEDERPAGAAIRVGIDIAPADAQTPWQRALREQDPAAVQEARWFCQAMANLEPGSRVALRGDADGWHAFLARGCGLEVVAAGEPMATVLIGAGAAAAVTRGEADGIAAQSLILFVPFAPHESEAMKALLAAVGRHVAVKGYQAVAVSPERAVLVARAEPLPAPVAA